MLYPHNIVTTYASGTGRALDIGAGRGDDSYYLAHMGFTVDAVDNKSKGMINEPSEILSELQHIAEHESLPIHAYETDIRDFSLQKYSLVIAINSLQFLKEDLPEVASRIMDSLIPGGRLIISLIADITPVGEKKKKAVLTEEYIRGLFQLTVVHSETRVVKEKPHVGANFPHSHTVIEFVGDKV